MATCSNRVRLTGLQCQPLLDDSDQHVDRDRRFDLHIEVLGVAYKGFSSGPEGL